MQSSQPQQGKTSSLDIVLEVVLVLATLTLVLELWPSVDKNLASFGRIVISSLDYRNWTRTIWLALNVVVVFVLLGVRVGPDLFAEWRAHRERIADERGKAEERRKRRERQEAIERIRQSRDRRI